MACTIKHSTFLRQLFSYATEMVSSVFKTVFLLVNVEMLLTYTELERIFTISFERG